MIRVLVVDDSRTFRAVLRRLLTVDPRVEVVAEAADGHEAVTAALRERPDVVTLDVRMPGQDGLAALAEIMRLSPTPVVIVSAEARDDRQTLAFRALQLGAVEVLPKPHGVGREYERQADEIRQAVVAVAGLTLVGRRTRAAAGPALTPPPAPAPEPARAPPGPRPLPERVPEVIGIAASTGGPAAIAQLLSALPADYPVPLLVVQHIARGFEGGFVTWLAGETRLQVRLAVDGALLLPGSVLVAPADRHLGASSGRARLDAGPAVGGFRPAATFLFESLARSYGARGAGLLLTGMGSDGAAGLELLRAAGGVTAAQGPRSSLVYGMPRVAIERGAAEAVELADLPALLLGLAGRPAGVALHAGAAAPGRPA